MANIDEYGYVTIDETEKKTDATNSSFIKSEKKAKSNSHKTLLIIIGVALLLVVILGVKGSLSKTDNNSYVNTENGGNDDTATEQPEMSIVDIPSITENIYEVDSLEKKAFQVSQAKILTYTGNIMTEKQEDVYTLIPTYSGIYRIDLLDMQNGTAVELFLYDSFGETIASDTYCSSGEGITVKDLQANNEYKIKLKQDDGYTGYVMQIGMQKDNTDITGITDLSDSVEFTDQRNVYTFAVHNDGRYRFELSGMQNGTAVELYMFDEFDNTVASDTYCTNGEGITVKDLKAGEVYEVQVRQAEGTTQYVLNIGYQKNAIELSDYTIVKDSIEFTDQRNVYTFTAHNDGRYRFELSGMKNGTAVELYMFNELGETVNSDTYCTNGEGITVKDLKAGEVYEIQIRQVEGFSSYNLEIGKPKSIYSVNINSIIKDCVEFTEQQNVYSFIPSHSGTISITLSDVINEMALELRVLNELGETIASDTYFTNEENVSFECESNKEYHIQVCQEKCSGYYSLVIN